ncbi:SEC-C metal-binding domain-containing protein [Paenibacillus sp. FSL F4-0236]|uniref:SEC-C metal-binding domain-containing protein n=1 Tax=Paenibacillus sp. FSL F4-0236 TaxID=2954731 RepID=UPI0030F87DF4
MCKCGSGLKYKKCCLNKSERNYSIVNNMHKEGHLIKIKAHPEALVEKAIDEYSFMSK